MRQRSSSTWSRNGISARLSPAPDTPAPRLPDPGPRPWSGLPPQALELVAREVGLWRARIGGDHPGVVRPRPRLVAALLGEEAQLVERRRCPRRGGIGLHDLLIHRGGRIRVLPGKRLADEVERVGRPLVGGEQPQEFPKAQSGRPVPARPVLLIGEGVHLFPPRARRIPRRPDGHARSAAAGIQGRHRLAGLLFEPPAQLRQPLLALSGQSQQRLTELRGRLEEQARQPVPALDTSRGGAGVPVGPSGNPAGPGREQMYALAYQQYGASRYGTARLGFREFLRLFPTNERAPDALYFIGESFAGENADSAAAVYQQVVKTYPTSPRAPAALYKLGFLAEQRGNKAGARAYYARVIADYPRAPEANLARDKLQRLGR